MNQLVTISRYLANYNVTIFIFDKNFSQIKHYWTSTLTEKYHTGRF